MKIFKKILLVIIAIIVVIYAFSIINSVVVNSEYGYKINSISENYHNKLFNENSLTKLDLVLSFGNKDEQISEYTYMNDYKLVIWDIKGYKNVDTRSINLFIVDSFTNIYPPHYITTLFDHYDIVKKQAPLNAAKIEMWVDKEMQLLKHFERTNYSYLNIISNGLIIKDSSDINVKLESKVKKNYNFSLINNINGFHFIILTNKNDSCMKSDILLNILDTNNLSIP